LEIWLSNGPKDKIRIPVNPESIGYKDTRNFEDIVLANGDEKTVISGRNLRTFTIQSFFPKNKTFYVQEPNLLPPMDYVRKIKKWMDDREVLHLQVTGTLINEPVTIRSFEWEEKGGAVGDIEYTLELKEYEPISYSKTVVGNKKPSSKKRPPSKANTKPKIHVVKKNESLWVIAKKYYGSGVLWRKIYERNKSIIGKNPNRIYPGQKLVIP
jgi:LysM repeat protein